MDKSERASNVLFHEPNLSFERAMTLYDLQAWQELTTPTGDDEWRDEMLRTREEMYEASSIAREIYQEYIQHAAAAMRGTSNRYVQAIGAALGSGDYSGLAL